MAKLSILPVSGIVIRNSNLEPTTSQVRSTKRILAIDMQLSALQITAPVGSEHKGRECALRLARLTFAYSIVAAAGALIVVIVAMLLKVQENTFDIVPLMRALTAVAVIFAFGFYLGRMKDKFLH